MEFISLDSDESLHRRGTHCLPHHRYLHRFHLPHCLLIAHIQEDVSGEWDVCGGQDDSDHWLAPSHDPVVMGGLLRRGDAPDKQGSSHKGNVDTGYPHLVEGE